MENVLNAMADVSHRLAAASPADECETAASEMHYAGIAGLDSCNWVDG